MKKPIYLLLLIALSIILMSASCEDSNMNTAGEEQHLIEENQQHLNEVQPSPSISWSLERESLINRFLLMNNRDVLFYMYIFNYGIKDPIGHYQINKVSSVNSQLTNPMQYIDDPHGLSSSGVGSIVVPSPAEDGSYGTNGDAIFGFTTDNIYIEHNMQYVVSTVPLNFNSTKLVDVSVVNLDDYQKFIEKYLNQ